MSSNVNKIYNSAMNYYQKGELDKAIDKCEEGISISLKNNNLLNLKGLLLYIKGDLEGANAIWKINRDYNNDEISKVYIKDSKKDEDKMVLFKWAEQDIKNLKIEDAVVKLNKCSESDFNSINVNIALAICYLRKGDYTLAKEYNEKALKINNKSKTAIELKKQIKSFEENPSDKFRNNIIKTVVTVATLAIIVTVAVVLLNKNNEEAKKNDKVVKQEEVKQVEVDQAEVKQEEVTLIDDKKESVKEEDKEEVIIKLLNDEEVQNEYIKGSDYFKDKKYDKAIEVLDRAYKNSAEMYLKDDVLFFLASSYDKSNLKTDAIKFYEEYVEKYSKENYIQEVYYNLALNYKDKDINKSKEYARIIKEKYSDSMYYNSNIEDIISN